MSKIKYFMILILLSSCNKKEKHYYSTGELSSIVEVDSKGRNDGELREFHENGKLKGIGQYIHGKKNGAFKIFYKNGNVKVVEKYKNNIWIDTVKAFYDTGELLSKTYKVNNQIYLKKFNTKGFVIVEGEIKDTKLAGWWKYYNDIGNLISRIEYLNLKENEQYVNQSYYYKNGLVLKDSSNYLMLDFPDTILVKKLVIGKLDLESNLTEQGRYYRVYYKFLNNKKDYNEELLDSAFGKINMPAKLWTKFKTTGHKILKGYVLQERLIAEENKKDTSTMDIINVQHKMYFKKDIFVLDSLKIKSNYFHK